MAGKREFDKLSKADKMRKLFDCVNCVLKHERNVKLRTSVYGIAKQYTHGMPLKVSDFDLIKNMTIDQIAREILGEQYK